ncbi:TolB family protein [Undibacterium sp. Di27W]|uniref:TolB family protein n=1 Tax=Undibacterium sp. Di27W TaxID=3413036 RepID=UPI003BF281D7
MHLLIIIVALLGIAYVLNQLVQKDKSGTIGATLPNSAHDPAQQSKLDHAAPGTAVAFISEGKLFYRAAHGEVKQLHSPYVQEMLDKMERHQEKNAWKQGTSFGISASGAMRRFDGEAAQINTTAMQFDEQGRILYFLQDAGMGGLFSYELETGVEKRILHRQNLALTDMQLDKVTGRLLASATNKTGVANLVMLDREGDNYRELTGGDTLDTSPCWIPDAEKQILYQSTGIARNQSGITLAHGNASIQMLDMKNGSVTPVLDDPAYDYLHPRVCPQGNLHFIRRPYEIPKYETRNALLDALLFPFRLLRAVFHYLNFFSMMYSRKPLTSASGPAMNADLKEIMLKGKRIDAEKALQKENMINGVPSLVPASWQLISRNRQGLETVLATNVVAYDMRNDGSIIYSNGRGVFLLGTGRLSSLILKSDLVADVIAQ